MRTTFLLFVPALMARDDWNTLWWLPEEQKLAPGRQIASRKTMPHLMFIPDGTPPTDGWPLLVFLHGQGESSPTPLPRVGADVAHAGRRVSDPILSDLILS